MKTRLMILLFSRIPCTHFHWSCAPNRIQLSAGRTLQCVFCFCGLISAPLLLPLVMSDPDSEELPIWLQIVSVPLNSLIWGGAVLVGFELVTRWRARATQAQRPPRPTSKKF